MTVDRIAWQRENAHSHYVGTLSASGDGIRLAGRDPTTGIRIGLRIPVEEIAGVHASDCPGERVAGERCVVLDLRRSIPLWLREVGTCTRDPAELAAALQTLLREGRDGASAN